MEREQKHSTDFIKGNTTMTTAPEIPATPASNGFLSALTGDTAQTIGKVVICMLAAWGTTDLGKKGYDRYKKGASKKSASKKGVSKKAKKTVIAATEDAQVTEN